MTGMAYTMVVKAINEETKIITAVWFSDGNAYQAAHTAAGKPAAHLREKRRVHLCYAVPHLLICAHSGAVIGRGISGKRG